MSSDRSEDQQLQYMREAHGEEAVVLVMVMIHDGTPGQVTGWPSHGATLSWTPSPPGLGCEASRPSRSAHPLLSQQHLHPLELFATLTLSTMLSLMQVVGRDGSEISAEGREDVISLGSAAFAQVRRPPSWVTVTA